MASWPRGGSRGAPELGERAGGACGVGGGLGTVALGGERAGGETVARSGPAEDENGGAATSCLSMERLHT